VGGPILRILSLIFLVSLLGCSKTEENSVSNLYAKSCDHAVVFFDLGDTIVDTKTHDFKKILYYLQTKNYLYQLKDDGHELGLIVDVPESWGDTHEKKMKKLVSFITGLWGDERYEDFDWSDFAKDLILLPPTTNDRKDHSNYLFKKAKEIVQEKNCHAVFQGEQMSEVKMANEQNIKGFLVQYDEDGEPVYMSPDDIRETVNKQ